MAKLNLKRVELERLSRLVNIEKAEDYRFLGYSLDFETGKIRDLQSIDRSLAENESYVLTVLLSHYILGKPKTKSGNLVKFKDLPGGEAYERAFLERAVQPVANAFGANPVELVEVAKQLNGKDLSHGDASTEIPSLKGVDLVYIVWAEGEFSASASVLFDESAPSFLPTEDLAILAELTTSRLLKAQLTLKV